jgi:hypothetical protein
MSDLTSSISGLQLSMASATKTESPAIARRVSCTFIAPYEGVLVTPFVAPEAVASPGASSRMPAVGTGKAAGPTYVDEAALRKLSEKAVQVQKEIAELRAAGVLIDERYFILCVCLIFGSFSAF